MASPTKQTEQRRAMKKAKVGKERKNALRLHGSTAKSLPLNKPNANEQKQAKKK